MEVTSAITDIRHKYDLAIVGGTGLYKGLGEDLERLEDHPHLFIRFVPMNTITMEDDKKYYPNPIPDSVQGCVDLKGLRINNKNVAFISRHGRNGANIRPNDILLSPSLIAHAIKTLGKPETIGTSAVGGPRDSKGGDIFLIDDFINFSGIPIYTDNSGELYISMSTPTNTALNNKVQLAAQLATADSGKFMGNATYFAKPISQTFETPGMVRMARKLAAEGERIVFGMTGQSEAEALAAHGIPYSLLAVVSNPAAEKGIDVDYREHSVEFGKAVPTLAEIVKQLTA